jgi:hypothetical protein
LAVKVLNESMDGTAASAENMELFQMTLDEYGACQHHISTQAEAQVVVDHQVEAASASAGDS